MAWLIALLSLVVSGCGSRTFKSQSFSSTATVSSTFTSINQKILQPKCVVCHDIHDTGGEKSLNGYAAFARQVRVGNPGSSSAYKVIESGEMPPNSPSLSDDEVLAVSLWIQNGANND